MCFDFLPASVLPACDAYDFEAVGVRLSDQWLLIHSVAVRVHRVPMLAVPVGGSRLGGALAVGSYEVASAVRDVLLGRPGFPGLRLRLVSAPAPEQWRVEWGEEPPKPEQGPVALADFYGYAACRPPADLGAVSVGSAAPPAPPSPSTVPCGASEGGLDREDHHDL